MLKSFSVSLGVATAMLLVGCKMRSFGDAVTSQVPSLTSNSALTQGYDRTLLASFKTPINATFIVADSLTGDRDSFAKLCDELVAANYNLAFVNVQARGYYMGKPGLQIEYAPGQTMLMPGYPMMKVESPILEFRARCGHKIKFVPWLEYGARAELVNDRKMIGLNGMGFDEKGGVVYIKNKPAVIGGAQKLMFYPPSWYLLNSATNEIFDESDKTKSLAFPARWLDIRVPEVKTFLLNFTDKMADMYGPLLDWDRVRFPQWTGSTPTPIANIPASEYQNQNNSVTLFFAEVGKRLQARGGALWVTVAKPLASRKKTDPALPYLNEEFGAFWFTWGAFSQLIIPMTYYDNTLQFNDDLTLIDGLSRQHSFKYLPIVGVDAPYRLFSTRPEYDQAANPSYRLANEANLAAATGFASENKVGTAFWYHCFKPAADSPVCD